MSEEELIETLREFEKNRVEKLEEPAKNLFYAIMKIADERDRLKELSKVDSQQAQEIIIELKQEIERLNNRLKTSNDTCNYLRNTIDKAIEYMDRRDLEWGSDEHNKMMDILKGSDK